MALVSFSNVVQLIVLTYLLGSPFLPIPHYRVNDRALLSWMVCGLLALFWIRDLLSIVITFFFLIFTLAGVAVGSKVFVHVKKWFDYALVCETRTPLGRIRRLRRWMSGDYQEKADCNICLQAKNSDLIINLCSSDSEGHEMCLNCFVEFYKRELSRTAGYPMLCPFAEEGCSSLSRQELENIVQRFHLDYFRVGFFGLRMSPQKLMQQYERTIYRFARTTLNQSGDSISCPFVDCRGCFFIEENDRQLAYEFAEDPQNLDERLVRGRKNKKQEDGTVGNVWLPTSRLKKIIPKTQDEGDLREFKCSECHRSSCIVCKRRWETGEGSHYDFTCDQYEEVYGDQWARHDAELLQNQKMIRKKVAKGIIKPCPGCGELIEKNMGCDHMYCTLCQTSFNWSQARAEDALLLNM